MPSYRVVECLPDVASVQTVLADIKPAEYLEKVTGIVENGITVKLLVIISEPYHVNRQARLAVVSNAVSTVTE